MTLKRELYRALEDVLGPENIDEEPAILDAYAWRSGMMAGTTKFMTRFESSGCEIDSGFSSSRPVRFGAQAMSLEDPVLS